MEEKIDIKPSEYEKITRDQIIGLEPVLEDVNSYIHFLRHFYKYSKYSVKIPPGVVFLGPRGTGKTKTAKYFATESNCPFIDLDDYSDVPIRKIYEGVRELREKNKVPVIIFQDEFDKRFLSREYGGVKLTKEGNELLKILDGVKGQEINYGIFFLGTANDIEGVEGIPLFRPGRLETLYFYPPSRDKKEELIDFFLKEFTSETEDVKHSVDSKSLSYLFNKNDSPAFIESVIRDSYLNAVERYIEGDKKDEITLTTKDIYKTIVKRKVTNPIVLDLSEEDKIITAVHEIGHYLVGTELGIDIPFITVIPTIQSLGATYLNDNKVHADESHIKNLISTSQAGLLAEEIFLGREGVELNDEGDIDYAIQLAKKLDKLYRYREMCKNGTGLNGVTDLNGVINAIQGNNNYSEPERALVILSQATLADTEYVSVYLPNILQGCEYKARRILENYDQLTIEKLSSNLIEERTLFKEDIDNIINK